MAFKPNYNQQRAERNRAKEARKQEKLQRREEDAAKRKAVEPVDGEADADAEAGDSEAGTPENT
jgi:hypothetical protein